MHPTLRSGYAVIGWRMFYFCHAWQKGVTAFSNNPWVSSSVRYENCRDFPAVLVAYRTTASLQMASEWRLLNWLRPPHFCYRNHFFLIGVFSWGMLVDYRRFRKHSASILKIIYCFMYLCSVLVIEAQRYNVGGRGVDSRWGPGRTDWSRLSV
jgi:hypothetical protein